MCRSCPCAGCAAQAMHAVTTGQKRVAQLLASPELAQQQDGHEVGSCGRFVATRCLMLLVSGCWSCEQAPHLLATAHGASLACCALATHVPGLATVKFQLPTCFSFSTHYHQISTKY